MSWYLPDRATAPNATASSSKGFAFVPAVVGLTKGDEVEFINGDAAPHTASGDDASWGTGELGKDQSAIVKFTQAGTARYHCRFHPHMRAQIIVTDGSLQPSQQEKFP